MNKLSCAFALLFSFLPCEARSVRQTCGSYPDRWREELQLHRLSRVKLQKTRSLAATARPAREDIGHIALLDDSNGVVARRNRFNLNRRTLRFLPSAGTAKYRFELGEDTYDAEAAASGQLITALGDDDTRERDLPFAFPYFGASYSKVFVNSDGTLTFGVGDASIAERSLGRVTAGPPRLAALFTDLDPMKARQGVKVLSEPGRFVVSWAEVPEFQDTGVGPLQTFQIRLYPDGQVEFAYSSVTVDDAVTGVARGRLQGQSAVVSFLAGGDREFDSSVLERFSGSEEIDIFTASQKFYENHEDAYDYLVFYNNLGIAADSGVVAFEVTIRNQRTGYGDEPADLSMEAGSPRRLQAILNMGQLAQYPVDPNSRVPARATAEDTPLTVLGHEAGHLFLALASVRDPANPESRPMLGRQTAHWNFRFNSEASLLEGNRIQDNGPDASPRFATVAVTQGFSALDQYLMGFLPPSAVPDTFLVQNASIGSGDRSPQPGVTFNGERRDIRIDEIIQAEGRRTPDSTVSQRRFRFAFVLVTAEGTAPTAEQVAQLEGYRAQFEAFFSRAATSNASAETSITKALRVSTFPASGVVVGEAATGSISIEKAAPAPVTVLLRSQNGGVSVPASVTIPPGGTTSPFSFTGAREGVDDITAEVAEGQYEIVTSKVQVNRPSELRVTIASGDAQVARAGTPLSGPVVIRVTDINQIPYPGMRVAASVSGGGLVSPASATTDSNGNVAFTWTPGTDPLQELKASVDSGASVIASALSRPAFASVNVVNAASFLPGLAPGGIATIFGTSLAGAQVSVNGRPAAIFYAGNRQVNFLVPASIDAGRAEIVVRTQAGASDAVVVPVGRVSPGVFFNSTSGFGAVLSDRSGKLTEERPVARGEFIEIYATGLGSVRFSERSLEETELPVQATIGGVPAEVLFSGPAPGFPGLYQVNAVIPAGASSGTQPLRLSIGGVGSNQVQIRVQ